MRFPIGTTILAFISISFFIITKIDDSWSYSILSTFYYELINIRDGEFWRLIIGPFIHFNYPHFLGNTIFLIVFGIWLERKFSTKMLIIVFLISNIIGFALIHIIYDYSGVYGISGSVCGLYGFLLMHIERKDTIWQWLKNYWIFILYGALLIMLAIMPGGLDMLHLFGIIVGAILALAYSDKYKQKISQYAIIICLIGALYVLFDPKEYHKEITSGEGKSYKELSYTNCEIESPDSTHVLSREQSLLQILAGSKISLTNLPNGKKDIRIFNEKQDYTMKHVLLESFSLDIRQNSTLQIMHNSGKCVAFLIPEWNGDPIIIDFNNIDYKF